LLALNFKIKLIKLCFTVKETAVVFLIFKKSVLVPQMAQSGTILSKLQVFVVTPKA
jgi:hypothetical protein